MPRSLAKPRVVAPIRGDSFPVGSGFAVFIPTGRAINPVSGSNWEGVSHSRPCCFIKGCTDEAYREALIQIESQSKDAEQRAEAAWASVTLEARLTQSNSLLGRRSALVKDMETAKSFWRKMSCILRQKWPAVPFIPLTHDTFALDGVEEPRLRFVTDRNG